MNKWRFDFLSAAIGSSTIFFGVMLMLAEKPLVSVEYSAFEKNAKIITKVDSAKTKDWAHPVSDTFVVIPASASPLFRYHVSEIEKQQKIPVFTR